jgi:nitronate monooxygenase
MDLLQTLGLRIPVIQAPMAGHQAGAMALAVSEAGGLGSLPCATLAPEGIARELATVAAATDRSRQLGQD